MVDINNTTMTIKDKYESYKLNDLCNLLTQEITDLSMAEDKLKLVFVLVHIIEESQKVLDGIDTSNLLVNLKDIVSKACEKSEKQKEILALKFSNDQALIRNLIDGKNNEFDTLQDDIEQKLEQLKKLIKQLVLIRDNMNPEEVKRSKQR